MFKSACVVGALIVLPVKALAEERFLCETTHSAGMHYVEEQGEWSNSFFTPGAKYIIAPPSSASSEFQFLVTPLGEDFWEFLCDQGFDDSSLLHCESLNGSFRMHRETLRFQETYDFGYLTRDQSTDQSGATPFIAIGICSPF